MKVTSKKHLQLKLKAFKSSLFDLSQTCEIAFTENSLIQHFLGTRLIIEKLRGALKFFKKESEY